MDTAAVIATGSYTGVDAGADDWFWWYSPTDETTSEELFLVPVDRYEAIQVRVSYILTKSVDALAPTKWENNGDGSIYPVIVLRSDRDTSLVEDFDSSTNARHKEWEENNAVGQNSSVATLSFLPSKNQ